MSHNQKFTGGCLCRLVQYKALGAPIRVAHCHCERCRRSTGAAFATGVCFPIEAVAWTQERPSLYKSSEGFARLFCRDCGSSVAQRNSDTGTTWLLLGTFDDPDSVKADYHMFTDEQVSWIKLDDGLPRHATFPLETKGENVSCQE